MQQQGRKPMKRILWIALIWPVAGCMSAANDSAICDATDAQRTAHAAALAADGGDKSVVTGQALIATLDATCLK
jgi:hypothetical protein